MNTIEVAVFTSDIERKFHKLFDIDSHYSWSKHHIFDSTQSALNKTGLVQNYKLDLRLDYYDDECSANYKAWIIVQLSRFFIQVITQFLFQTIFNNILKLC